MPIALARAIPQPSLSQLRLRGARLLVDKFEAVGAATERMSDSGRLIIPALGERTRRTYGISARVLAIGPGIDPADIAVGDTIIIDEFGGRPLWWHDRTLPYWIVGIGEVMISLRRDGDPSDPAPDSGAA